LSKPQLFAIALMAAGLVAYPAAAGTEPVAKPAADAAAKPAADNAARPTPKPFVKAGPKPAADPATKPVAMWSDDAPVKPANKQTTRQANKPTTKPAADQIAASAKPVAKTADKSAATSANAAVAGADDAHGLLRAQVLLDRAHYSSGEIDGSQGSNLRKAVTGFQKLNQLPLTGVLDDATWAVLSTDQAPVLDLYTVTAADVAGPYKTVPATMADKAKLPALGYANLAEALGEKFHSSPSLLRRLNPGKTFARVGEQLLVPNVAAAKPLPKAASILVDASDGTLTLLDAGGMPIAQFPASTGSIHDPLPEGRWEVRGVATNPDYRYNPKLFWDAKAGDAKARIAPGPNNPVGAVWIQLSKPHYGIHGTPEPGKIGKTQSHGCIRLTNWDAQMVARAIARGAVVLLQS
jgi:lipoprotein-anchoring transpeptidase ErfK/SrfK